MMRKYYVCFLKSNNERALYIGVTSDLVRRISEHRSNANTGFSWKYCCSKLVYVEEFSEIEQAIAREKQLKKWSRCKKEALISSFDPRQLDEYNRLADPSTALGMTQSINLSDMEDTDLY